jgi:hypothetical protein
VALKLGAEAEPTLEGLSKENPSPEMIEVAEVLAAKRESLGAWQGSLSEERLKLLSLLHTDEARALLESLSIPADNPGLGELRLITLRSW